MTMSHTSSTNIAPSADAISGSAVPASASPANAAPAEIEATFIDIDKDALRARLKSTGAQLVQPEILMRRVIFDLGPNSFVRVRDEGGKITMSYKHLEKLSLSGMQEICIEVSNYEDAIALLKHAGLEAKADQETLRETWGLDGVEITIDTWPWIPAYSEIEGPSEEAVQAVATRLGFQMSEAHYGAADEIYKLYYDVTNDDINFCPEIKFTEIPQWLAEKKRPESVKLPK